MKKFFYSLAIALVALMVSIPAKAKVQDVSNFDELFYLYYTNSYNSLKINANDTIRLAANITFSDVDDARRGFLQSLVDTRTLDLNGYTLKKTSYHGLPYVINLRANQTLNILDSRGGGQIIQNNYDVGVARWAAVVYTRDKNVTVNIYGGALIATINNTVVLDDIYMRFSSAVIFGYEDGVYAQGTVNMYGGSMALFGNMYHTGSATLGVFKWNPNVRLNLYGGTIGSADLMSSMSGVYVDGLNQAFGTMKEGIVYGVYGKEFFQDIDPLAKVYINNVLTPSSTYLNAAEDAYAHSKVELRYAPEITVSGVEVTKDNCDDILGDGKVGFDIASNTLYLKTKEAGKPNTINGNIVYDDFKLNIVVDGIWSLNGRIVGHDGDLIISPAHFALTEEDGDILAIHSQNSTAVSLNGKSFCAKNRVRVFIEDNNTHTQTAVSCGMFVINNAWFDAWGKKPIVDCQNSMITNAKITSGSLKNNDVIQVEPNITKYVVWVEPNDYNAGSTNGDAYVAEGTSHTAIATPNSGYHFLRWSNGVTENPYTFVVTQDTVLYALFEADVVINYYDINVVSADETMGTVSGGGTHIEQGQTVTITATPNEGYQFLYWTTADGQVQGAISQWTVTKDETLIAHFRVAPPADAYNLWVCGTQVTGSNSADILGDGVWCYDNTTRTLTVMKDATYNITNNGFIEDWAGSGTDEPLIVNVGNHKVEAICTTTDNTLRNAIVGTKGMTFTGTTYHGVTLTAQNMYAANFSKPLTVTGHMDLTLNLKNTTDWGKDNFKTAVLLAGVTPSLIVDGANLYINSGVGESAGSGYKATNKTDQAANLSLNNASIQWGSISSHDLGILDDSPKYEINYLTPALESLCLTSAFGLSFFEGTHFNLYAYPATGYKFVSWSDGNTDNPRLIIMPAHNVYLDPIVEVDESQNPKGAIINASVTEGQGTITNFTSGWYAEGTELTITAVPAEGYKFVQWSDGETANPYFITVEDKKNINITAMFEPTTTAVSNVESQQASIESRKVLHNGILFINRNGKTYSVTGQEVR